MADYDARAQELGFAPKEEIKKIVDASKGDDVVFLDVRGESEIAAEPFKGEYKIVYTPCSRTDASELVQTSKDILPDKEANVIVFCRSGARAKTAKEALEAEGYTKVYNAGGVTDMDYLTKKESSCALS
mmetsp:Transcript_16547/g.31343  ORF Transcript_16547/g.31343 Transcript_16547/m.31343 type:complete len:129 (-) Transcript_16547:266-652(-)|eukprot:CAMPEP_0176491900 /NCGR_PEP_ID=MMETSP0200_2-20121128/8682_1 /TAXON_ID=947934 /ORGANISM="Chaetoceros sp., Strain GSL56" /LENGTH=128 /DNA_ID=CAMNT_0017889367 /DNA_START=126 /DNA_END=512 /DNA_ORIENTATION=-